MLTILKMQRSRIITKEAMKKYSKGEEDMKDSVNDDLESLFENLRLGKEIDDKNVYTYFLPKLTEDELDLVERQDASYLQTFYRRDPDVKGNGMMFSESDSKFVSGIGYRRTFKIENSSSQNIANPCPLQ